MLVIIQFEFHNSYVICFYLQPHSCTKIHPLLTSFCPRIVKFGIEVKCLERMDTGAYVVAAIADSYMFHTCSCFCLKWDNINACSNTLMSNVFKLLSSFVSPYKRCVYFFCWLPDSGITIWWRTTEHMSLLKANALPQLRQAVTWRAGMQDWMESWIYSPWQSKTQTTKQPATHLSRRQAAS